MEEKLDYIGFYEREYYIFSNFSAFAIMWKGHFCMTRGTNFDKKEIKSNFFSDYVGFSKEETNLFLEEFFRSNSHVDILPVFGAIEAIQQLSGYDLVDITIRPESWRLQTEEWLNKNFKNAFSGLYMLGVEA